MRAPTGPVVAPAPQTSPVCAPLQQSNADAASELSSSGAEAPNQSLPPYDELQTAVGSHDIDAARAAYCLLSDADRERLGTDPALLRELLALFGPVDGRQTLRDLHVDAERWMEHAAATWPGDTETLRGVLADVGITGSATVFQNAGVFERVAGFATADVLRPLLADGDLAGQGNGLADDATVALLRRVFPGETPFDVLPTVAADSLSMAISFEASPSAQAWMAENPLLLGNAITAWGTGADWIGTFEQANRLDVLQACVDAGPDVWADAFHTRVVAPTGADIAAFAPGTGLGPTVVDLMGQLHPDEVAAIAEGLTWPALDTLTLGFASGWLTTEILTAVVAGPTADAASQAVLAAEPFVQLLGGTFSIYPTDLLQLLAADVPMLTGLYATNPGFAAWMNTDWARLKVEIASGGSLDLWAQAFLDSSEVLLLLKIAQEEGAPWQVAVDALATFDAVLAACPNPVADEVAYDGLFVLYGEGVARTAAQSQSMFVRLGGARVLPAGERNPSLAWNAPAITDGPNTWNLRKQLLPIDGDGSAWSTMLGTLRTMSRTSVQATRTLAFVHDFEWEWQQTAPVASSGWRTFAAPQLRDLGTSYAWSGIVVLHTDAAGAPSTSLIGADAGGTGRAVGGGRDDSATGGTDQRTTPTPLTMFQNHAEHEFGHSVGAAGVAGGSGNSQAQTYGGWTAETPAAFTSAMWTTADADSFAHPVTGAAIPVTAADAAAYCVAILSTGAEPAGANSVAAIPGLNPAQRFALIQASPKYGSQEMVKYLASVFTGNPSSVPNNAFRFTGYTPPGDPHIYATRFGNSFGKYDADAYGKVKPTVGWYALSSPVEMFAEIYTKKYSGGGVPASRAGVDWNTFFTELEASPGAPLAAGAVAAPTAPTTTAPSATEVEPPVAKLP